LPDVSPDGDELPRYRGKIQQERCLAGPFKQYALARQKVEEGMSAEAPPVLPKANPQCKSTGRAQSSGAMPHVPAEGRGRGEGQPSVIVNRRGSHRARRKKDIIEFRRRRDPCRRCSPAGRPTAAGTAVRPPAGRQARQSKAEVASATPLSAEGVAACAHARHHGREGDSGTRDFERQARFFAPQPPQNMMRHHNSAKRDGVEIALFDAPASSRRQCSPARRHRRFRHFQQPAARLMRFHIAPPASVATMRAREHRFFSVMSAGE